MTQLPGAKIYEAGLEYWPYRDSLQVVLDHVVTHTPQTGRLLDIMCGPGYLLGKISEMRDDLWLYGVDNDDRYVSHGNDTYKDVVFEHGDVLTWRPKVAMNVVLCTGAAHHIPYELQGAAFANIASMVKPEGFAIISDCYVNDYADEKGRKLAAAKLGYEYLRATIENGAPDDVVKSTVDILYNDVMMIEYKMSIGQRLKLLERHFRSISTMKTWPKDEPSFASKGYGDYVHVCVK